MRKRTVVIMGVFSIAVLTILGRLIHLGVQARPEQVFTLRNSTNGRPAILDRNGVVLSMDIPITSVYASPRVMVDIDDAVERITATLPDLDRKQLHRRLSARGAFAWIRRHITPKEEQALWNAGIPGLSFQRDKKRIYPNGALAAHVLGAVNVDNIGISGLEKWIETDGLATLRQSGIDLKSSALNPIMTSLDIRVQYALEDEIGKAIKRYAAKAGAGLVLDVNTGEILALASLPTFDPNAPADALKPDRINRIAASVFEMGSTFKALTTAMALESGQYTTRSMIDASKPVAFGRMRIRDFEGKYRPLSLQEAFIYSSNISMAKIAMQIGKDHHQEFLRRFGQMETLRTELPETATPMLPRKWGDITTATASFGHGIAVTPLQASMGVAALVNGGTLIRPTFIKGDPVETRKLASRLVSPNASEAMRFLLFLNAEQGSARNARIIGYRIGGKTGTAEKVVGGRYSKTLNITSFMGVVPVEEPRFLILTLLDEPKGLPETHGFRTSGWNAVPLGGAVLKRVLPMLGQMPSFDGHTDPFSAFR